MVRVHAGEPIFRVVQPSRLHSGKLEACPTFPSVAQQQSTRQITGRPWSVTTRRDHFKGGATGPVALLGQSSRLPHHRWMAQTDERRAEDPQRLARYQLQRPVSGRAQRASSSSPCSLHSAQLSRGIDVTVTCESSKLITSGQHRHAAPFPKWGNHPDCL
jgi:hypothetical protein